MNKLRRTLLTVLITLLLLLGSLTWDRTLIHPWLTLLLVATLGGGLLLWLANIQTPVSLPKLLWPVVGMFVLQFLLLGLVPLPYYSLTVIGGELFILLVFLAAFWAAKDDLLAKVLQRAGVGVGIVAGLLELFSALLWYSQWWRVAGSIFSLPPLGYRSEGLFFWHPNTMGGFFSLVTFLALGCLLEAHTVRRKLGWVAVLLLFSFAIYHAASRGGMLGLAAGLVVFGVLRNLDFLVGREKVKQAVASSPRKAYLYVSLAMVIGLILAPLLARQILFTQHGPLSDRVYIWQNVLRIFSLSPIWGHGSASFMLTHAQVSDQTAQFLYSHAHNLFLQSLAETGLIGLILLLTGVGLGLSALWAAWKEPADEQAVSRLAAHQNLAVYAGALTALFVHLLVDMLVGQMLYAWTAGIILALALRYTPQKNYFSLGKGVSIAFSGGICLLLFGITALVGAGGSAYAQAVKAVDAGEWEAARERVCRAADDRFTPAFFDFQCSLAYAMANSGAIETLNVEKALRYGEQGLAADPYWVGGMLNQASYVWQLGEREKALELLRQAQREAPLDLLTNLNLGWAAESLGLEAEASQAYLQVACLDPLRRQTIFFRTPFRQQAVQAPCPDTGHYVLNSPALEIVAGSKTALDAGNLKEAEDMAKRAIQLDPQSALAYAVLGKVQQELGQSDAAIKSMRTALFINPRWTRVLIIAGPFFVEAGDETFGMQLLERAFKLQQGASYPGEYTGVIYHYPNLQTDISPFLQRAFLTPEMDVVFTTYADWLGKQGETEHQAEVLNWLAHERQVDAQP